MNDEGAKLTKFFLKWAELIESGECSNDSLELYIPGHGTFKKHQVDTDNNLRFTIDFIESEDE